jgi:hypothetical protein
MAEKKLTPNKRRRIHAMMWAYLHHGIRGANPVARDIIVWRLLLEWASLGGTPDEVIR